jgi:hypothetical protein
MSCSSLVVDHIPDQVTDYVMDAQAAGLRLEHASEHLVERDLADRNPRAAKFLGWPLLLMLGLRRDPE